MVRNVLFKVWMFSLALLCCTACSQHHDYVDAIPADATTVVEIDVSSLAEKAHLADYKAMLDMGLFYVSRLMTPALGEQLHKVIDDPSALGIDFSKPAYLFITEKDEPNLLLKVADRRAVEKLLEQLGRNFHLPLENREGNTWMTSEAGSLLLNDDLLLVTLAGQSQLEQWLELDKDERFAGTAQWKGLQNVEGDVRMFVAASAVYDYFEYSPVTSLGVIDYNLVCGLLFADGLVRIETDALVPKEFEILQQEMVYHSRGKFLRMMPADPICWMSVCVNGEALNRFLESVIKHLPEYGEALEQFTPWIASLDGEIALGMHAQQGESPLSFTLFAEVKDDYWLKHFDKNESEYDRMMEVGMIGKDVFFFTSHDKLKGKKKETVKPSLEEEDWAENTLGKTGYLFLNADALNNLLVDSGSADERRFADEYLPFLNRLEVISERHNRTVISLYLNDNQSNALQQILQLGLKQVL